MEIFGRNSTLTISRRKTFYHYVEHKGHVQKLNLVTVVALCVKDCGVARRGIRKKVVGSRKTQDDCRFNGPKGEDCLYVTLDDIVLLLFPPQVVNFNKKGEKSLRRL